MVSYMNKYEKKLQYLRNEWIGEVMTIRELDNLSEDHQYRSQWDDGYNYINFLEEGCRAFCNYVIYYDDKDIESNDKYSEDEEFEYFWDKDIELNCSKRTEVLGIWAEFDVLDDYDKEAVWNDAANVHIKIKAFELV